MDIKAIINKINTRDNYRILQIGSNETVFHCVKDSKIISEMKLSLGINRIITQYFKTGIPSESDVEYAINTIEDELMSDKALLNKNENLYSTFEGIGNIIDYLNSDRISISTETLEEIFTNYALKSMDKSPIYDDAKMNNEKYAGLLILREIMNHLNFRNITLFNM